MSGVSLVKYGLNTVAVFIAANVSVHFVGGAKDRFLGFELPVCMYV